MLRKFIICAVFLLGCLAFAGHVYAQEEPTESDTLHWAMSSFLGTGWYQIDDSLSIFVVRIPPRPTIRKSWFNSRDDRGIGIEIKYNTTLGLFAFDDLPSVIDFDNVGTFSFTPGVDLEIPVKSIRRYHDSQVHKLRCFFARLRGICGSCLGAGGADGIR